MQLTGPLFLYLFLPLSLLLLPFCPARYRKAALSLLSVLWYVLANIGSPLGLLQVAAVILLITLLAILPDGDYPRLRCFFGVAIPLLFLLTARILAEYTVGYPYPYGITLVSLGGISLSIDRYRGDAPERDKPLDVIGYLLFFPTLTLGPILRYKQYLYITEKIAPSFAAFSRGAQRYMLGLVKRIAGAAVILRAIGDLLSYGIEFLSPISLLALLLLAYLFLYFFLSGTVDMAKGLMEIYGLRPPRGIALLCDTVTPHRLLYSMTLSLERYLQDYVTAPIRRRLGGRGGSLLAACAVFAITVLFYRTRPVLLLLALPVLISALLCNSMHRWQRTPHNPLLRLLLSFLSALSLSLFSLGLLLKNPLDLLPLLKNALAGEGSYSIYYIYSALPDGPYIVTVLLILLVGVLLHRFAPAILKKLPRRLVAVLRPLATAALFAAFLVTLFHLLPQFPTYANEAIRALFTVR